MRPRSHIFESYSSFMQAASSKLLAFAAPAKLGKDLHFRRALKNPTRTFINEEEVEALFQKMGYCIVFPETIDLSEQLSILANADYIAGFIGSFFHLAPAVKSHAKRIYLSLPSINGKLLLTDCVSLGSAHYVNCMEPLGNTDRPLVSCNIPSLQAQLEAIKC